MNRENEKQSVLIKTFEGTALDEISAEYNLPDYLPDINRLLKVSAKISESSHYLSGDAVEYDGKLKCAILYATGDGSLKSAEFERDFSGTTAVSGTSGDCDIRFEPQIASVSCRLQNPRKLTAKMKLSLATSVLCANEVSPIITGKISADDEKTLEARTHSIASVCSAFTEEKNTPISEDIELEASLPAIDEIVSVEMDPYMTDIRVGDGKVIYKGDIFTNILYLAARDDNTEAGAAPKYVSFCTKIPIAGEIMADGISERYIPFASVAVSTPEFRPQTNAFGENRTAEIDFDYSVSVELFCNEESILTTDMYSTEYESTAEADSLRYDSVLAAKTFNFTSEGSVKTDDSDFDKIVMTSATASIDRTEKAGNKLWFTGSANVSVILTNGEGIYLAKNFEIPLRAETDGMGLHEFFDIQNRPTVLSASARLDGDSIHVNLETLISYIIFEKHNEPYVQKLSVYKDKPIIREKDASLLLCYPAPTDSLWDIAKKYSTTTAAIMEMNGISAESTPTVLVIPRRESISKKGHRIL